MKQLITSFLLVLMLTACQRDDQQPEAELLNTYDTEIEELIVSGDSIIAVGSNVLGQGRVFYSVDNGDDWKMTGSFIPSHVYGICKVSDSWYLGLDSVELMVSDDLIYNRHTYWPEELWVGDLYKQPIRAMKDVNDQFIIVAGGELAFGSIHHWDRTQNKWTLNEFDHELRSLHIDSSEGAWRALVGGDGILLEKRAGYADWHRVPIKDWFVVGAWWRGEELFIVNHKGDIWSSVDNGEAWIRKHSAPGNPLVLKCVGTENGFIMLESKGRLGMPVNDGWKWIQLDTESDIRAACIKDDRVFVAAGNQMFRFDLAALQE